MRRAVLLVAILVALVSGSWSKPLEHLAQLSGLPCGINGSYFTQMFPCVGGGSTSTQNVAPLLLEAQGDSITAGYGTTGYGSGNNFSQSYANRFAQSSQQNTYGVVGALGTVDYVNDALSGYTIANMTAQQTTVTNRLLTSYGVWVPNKIVTILIGTNDRSNATYYPSGSAAWLSTLFTYTDALRAAGYKVLVATQLPISAAMQVYGDLTVAQWDAWRAAVKTGLVGAIGTHINGIIDFAADPIMGSQAAVEATTYYQDGVHPTDAGQALLRTVYTAAVNAARVDPAPPVGFTTWNPSDKGAGVTLSNGNLTATGTTFASVRSVNYHYRGKYYFEFALDGSSNNLMVGVSDQHQALTSYPTGYALPYWMDWGQGGVFAGVTAASPPDFVIKVNSPGSSTLVLGSKAGIAIDFDTGKGWFSINGVFPASGNPVAETNPTFTFPPNMAVFLQGSFNAAGAQATLPASSFTYPVPGYSAW